MRAKEKTTVPVPSVGADGEQSLSYVTNDIIELFFLQHPSVLPTLRKIHDIDFFIKLNGRIVPFDLKFTHISDSYFDLASQGIFVLQACNQLTSLSVL